MRRILLTIFLLFITSVTYAVGIDRSITFTPPTELTNGEILNESSIDHYNIYCGSVSGGYDSVPVAVLYPPATSGTINLDRTVEWYCVMTTVLIPTENSLESGYSNEVVVHKKFFPALGIVDFSIE